MYQISSYIYNRLASELQNYLSSTTIFSGTIELFIDDVELRFVATIIPYFHQEKFPEGDVEVLGNISAVWWDLHTIKNGDDIINDFDFETLKFLICQQ